MLGEQKALTDFLKLKKVVAPQVPRNTATGDRNRDLSILESTLSSVQKRYASVAPRDTYTQVALAGMLGGLGDPYTTYLSPKEIRGLDEQLQGGHFGGIGVYIVKDPRSGQFLVDPIEGNPAIKAGVSRATSSWRSTASRRPARSPTTSSAPSAARSARSSR